MSRKFADVKNAFCIGNSVEKRLSNCLDVNFTGYYMYTEASYPRKQGDVARLSSPFLDFNGKMCLSFFYHMYGKTMGSLTVQINGRSLFTISSDQGNQWIEAKIPMSNMVGKYKVKHLYMYYITFSPRYLSHIFRVLFIKFKLVILCFLMSTSKNYT